MKKILVIGMLAMIFPAVSSVMAKGHDDENRDPNIAYRVKIMRSIGANMGSIGDILKNKLPFPGHIANHARSIEISGKMVAAAFEKKVLDKKSTSKPNIWEDFSKFKKASDAMVTEAAALATIADGGDMKAVFGQMKKLGGTCKDCHKEFRKKKEKK